MGNLNSRLAFSSSYCDRLSDELLTMILLCLRHEAHHDQSDVDWLHVLHTCRRWRRLALSSPKFWQIIDMESSSQRRFFLNYAKRSPITVHQTIAKDLSPEIEQMLTEHLDHISELTLNLEPINAIHVEHWIARFLTPETAPLLRSLALQLSFDSSEDIHVPNAIWSLATLHLSNVRFQLSSLRPQPSVIVLTLRSNIEDNAAFSFVRTRFTLELLRCTPNLVELELDDAALGPHTGNRLDTNTIFLPSLQNFSFRGKLRGLNLFCDILRVSTRCTLQAVVHTSRSEDQDEEVDDLYLQLQSYLLRRQDGQGKPLPYRVYFQDDGGLQDPSRAAIREHILIEELSSELHPYASSRGITVASIRLTHHIWYLRTGDRVLHHLSDLIRGLPSTCVESVEMESRVIFDLTGSRTRILQGGSTILGAFRSTTLRTLDLNDIGCAQWLLFALSLFEASHSVVLPALEELLLRGINPSIWWRSSSGNSSTRDGAAWAIKDVFMNLQAALEGREASHGHKLKCLSIYDSCPPRAWMLDATRMRQWSELEFWDGNCWEDRFRVAFDDIIL